MRAPHQTESICKTVLTVLVALFVAVRVVAQPVILAAPAPGLMAVCSGGQITYVSIETGQPVETDHDSGLASDPCPFFGVTTFDLASGKPAFTPAQVITAHHLVPTVSIEHVPGFFGPNTARAPPAQAPA